MSQTTDNIAFVVKPVTNHGGPIEFRQAMAPHPLVYQELPHDPQFGIYNRRLRSLSYLQADHEDIYWRLRRQVVLAHTGELPTEIRGPDAEAMLNRVFTRDVSRVRVGRCSYQVACYPDGGTIIDGVLMRLGQDRFWYAQGDGEFQGWLRAQSEGFEVEVFDPSVWVSQVQGPRSMDVLAEVSDTGMPDPFRYFDLTEIRIADQPVVISRTGFTNELGWECYFGPEVDARVLGDRIMEAGAPHNMHTVPAAVTNIRRIEGGLLFAGTDFDSTVTPFTAGLGTLVDLDKPDFVGKKVLAGADQRKRTWGLQCPDGVPHFGDTLFVGGESAGRVLSSAWSPFLRVGIGIVRVNDPELSPGTSLEVECADGQHRSAELCRLPFYDQAGDIPRGRRTDIPEIPGAGGG